VIPNARYVDAITLARNTPAHYQVTYWRDGTARFDGRSGQRQGAWQAQVPSAWLVQAAKLARKLQSGYVSGTDSSATLVLDTSDDRLVYSASDGNEPPEFWILSTLLDGMCHRSPWLPLDTSGKDDFTRFAAGTPIWITLGDTAATGFGLNGAVLVLAGAQASTSTSPSLHEAYQRLRSDLIDTGDLVLADDRFRLTRHLSFTSPSAAASVLVGSNTSGRRAWKGSSARTWSELDLDA
jgi:hypothetical protein